MDHLRESIESLYAAFAPNPRPTKILGCPCCHPAGSECELLSVPLRRLTERQLSRYAASACTTWGGPTEFRHFLPRILELTVAGELCWPDIEATFGKLASAGWAAWPAVERQAVEEFCKAIWESTLESPEPYHSPEEVLCALSQANIPLTPYLDVWSTCKPACAAGHLLDFLDANTAQILKSQKLSDAFWKPEGETQTIAWLLSSQTEASVAEALLKATEETRFDLLFAIRERLQILRRP